MHELGHNMGHNDWCWPEVKEVNPNIFAVLNVQRMSEVGLNVVESIPFSSMFNKIKFYLSA